MLVVNQTKFAGFNLDFGFWILLGLGRILLTDYIDNQYNLLD